MTVDATRCSTVQLRATPGMLSFARFLPFRVGVVFRDTRYDMVSLNESARSFMLLIIISGATRSQIQTGIVMNKVKLRSRNFGGMNYANLTVLPLVSSELTAYLQ